MSSTEWAALLTTEQSLHPQLGLPSHVIFSPIVLVKELMLGLRIHQPWD